MVIKNYLTLFFFLSINAFGSSQAGGNIPVARSVDESSSSSFYDPKSRITITNNGGIYSYSDESGNLLGTSYDLSSNPVDIESISLSLLFNFKVPLHKTMSAE